MYRRFESMIFNRFPRLFRSRLLLSSYLYSFVSLLFRQWPLTVVALLIVQWLRLWLWIFSTCFGFCFFPAFFTYRRIWKTPPVLRTAEDRFSRLGEAGYSFAPNYFDYKDVRVHYLDEGPKDAKEVVLLLHGQLTWSFVYRNVIHVISDKARLNGKSIRVVALDFIGFGRSDKYTDSSRYTLELHKGTIRALLERLDLINVTLVVHEWSGPVALALLKDLDPPRVSRLVLMNTGLPGAPQYYHYAPIQVALNFLLWWNACSLLGRYLPVSHMLQLATRGLNRVARMCYAAPFPDSVCRVGVYTFSNLLPLFRQNDEAAEEMKKVATFLNQWHQPALVMFSTRCPITRGLDKYFLTLVPGSTVPPTVIKAGHFLQEEKPQEVGQAIYTFVCTTEASQSPARGQVSRASTPSPILRTDEKYRESSSPSPVRFKPGQQFYEMDSKQERGKMTRSTNNLSQLLKQVKEEDHTQWLRGSPSAPERLLYSTTSSNNNSKNNIKDNSDVHAQSDDDGKLDPTSLHASLSSLLSEEEKLEQRTKDRAGKPNQINPVLDKNRPPSELFQDNDLLEFS